MQVSARDCDGGARTRPSSSSRPDWPSNVKFQRAEQLRWTGDNADNRDGSTLRTTSSVVYREQCTSNPSRCVSSRSKQPSVPPPSNRRLLPSAAYGTGCCDEADPFFRPTCQGRVEAITTPISSSTIGRATPSSSTRLIPESTFDVPAPLRQAGLAMGHGVQAKADGLTG